jgi:hypothetical protein
MSAAPAPTRALAPAAEAAPASAAYEKLVTITRKTPLAQLLERWGTRGQARYAVERCGGDFAELQREDDAYRRALAEVERGLEIGRAHV